MINIQNLDKSYQDESGESIDIYKDLNIEIHTGDFVAIQGPSGSGKTTLLHLISGLDSFQNGEISIGKMEISKLSEDQKTDFRAKNISFIFQQFHLIDNLTVTENIDLVIDLNKLERQYQTKELLDIIGLEEKADAYPYNLSGGERQRVAIARAFVGKTSILLADEPTGNLDKKNSDIVMELIKKLHKTSGNTIIMITHDTEIAQQASRQLQLSQHSLIETHA